MFKDTKAYSGIAVKDLEAAKRFYGEALGVTVSELGGPLAQLDLAGGERPTLLYEQPEMTPASYTVLNFPVTEIEPVVDALTERGVEFERYEDAMPGTQDEKGIFRGEGPTIAWFKDPSGNVISVIEDPEHA